MGRTQGVEEIRFGRFRLDFEAASWAAETPIELKNKAFDILSTLAYVLQHRVELIDELDDHRGVFAEVNVAFLSEPGLQPRPGQQPGARPPHSGCADVAGRTSVGVLRSDW